MNADFPGVPLTREQAQRVDQLAVEQFGMLGLVLMENAGRGCADVLCRLGIAGPVVICCGRGNNAGDGFVLARHLDLRGYTVRLVLCGDPGQLRGDAAHNFQIADKAGIPLTVLQGSTEATDVTACLRGAAWLVDALLGTGAQGVPRPPLDRLIDALNDCPARKMAVDLPSGLDCDSGRPAPHTFRADHTCTFVAMKHGFLTAAARPYLGEVHVLDIGVPRRLLAQLQGDPA